MQKVVIGIVLAALVVLTVATARPKEQAEPQAFVVIREDGGKWSAVLSPSATGYPQFAKATFDKPDEAQDAALLTAAAMKTQGQEATVVGMLRAREAQWNASRLGTVAEDGSRRPDVHTDG